MLTFQYWNIILWSSLFLVPWSGLLHFLQILHENIRICAPTNQRSRKRRMSKRTSHLVSSLSASTAKEEVWCGGRKNVENVIRQGKRRVQNHPEQTSSKGLANSNRYSDKPSSNSWKYPRYLIIKKSSMAWKQRNELPQLALIILFVQALAVHLYNSYCCTSC